MKFLDSHPFLPLLVNRRCDLVNVRAEKLSEVRDLLPWIDSTSLDLVRDTAFCRTYPGGFVCDLYPDELARAIAPEIFARVLNHGWFFRRAMVPPHTHDASPRILCLFDAESGPAGTENRLGLHLRILDVVAESLGLSVEVRPIDFIDSARLTSETAATACLLISDSDAVIERGNLFAVHNGLDLALVTSAHCVTARASAWGWAVIRPPDSRISGGRTVRDFVQEIASWLRRPASVGTIHSCAADPLVLFWLTSIYRANAVFNDEQTRYRVAHAWASITNGSPVFAEQLAAIGSALEDAGATRELQVFQLFRAAPPDRIEEWFQASPRNHLSVRALIITYLYANAHAETDIARSVADVLLSLSTTHRSTREQYQRFVAPTAVEPAERAISDLAQGYLEVCAWSGVECAPDHPNDCWAQMVDAVHHLRRGAWYRPSSNLALDENGVEWICDQVLWPWGYLMPAIRRDTVSNNCVIALKHFLGESARLYASAGRLQLRLSACERNDADSNALRIEPDQVACGEAARVVLYLTLAGRNAEATELWSYAEKRGAWSGDPLAAPDTGVVHLWYSRAEHATQVAWNATDPTHSGTLRPSPGELINLWLVAVTLRISELERATAHVLRLCEPQFRSLDLLRDSVPTNALPDIEQCRNRWRKWTP